MCLPTKKIWSHDPDGQVLYKDVTCWLCKVTAVQFESYVETIRTVIRGWICPECHRILGTVCSYPAREYEKQLKLPEKELLDPNKPPWNEHYCLICGGFGPLKEHVHKIPPDTILFPDLNYDLCMNAANQILIERKRT